MPRDKVKERATRVRLQNANPNHNREVNLKAKFGMTLAEFNEILADQDGACAICKSKSSGQEGRAFQVDHDHVTGQVRGLLCLNCNLGIGHLKEDALILRKALEYLETSIVTS